MKKTIIIISFLFFTAFVSAGNEKVQAGYEVHYIAFGSLSLSPEVAKSYNIERSANRGYVNISVLKQQQDSLSSPVEAVINISAKNLYGQKKNIKLRKIAENDGAIYYISTFKVSSREAINFKAQISPVDSKENIEIKFSQEFYTD